MDIMIDKDMLVSTVCGPSSTPVSIWLSFANRWLSLLDIRIWGRLPPANWVCNGQAKPSVAGTLLFPVQTFGTAYQPTCVSRHCRRQLLHDTWRHTCSAALNDICLQRVWVFFKAALFISDFIIMPCPLGQGTLSDDVRLTSLSLSLSVCLVHRA